MVSNWSEVLEVAAKYYKNLYKRTISTEQKIDLEQDLSLINDEFEKITIGEIEFALSMMKNSKATGTDGISSDIFKIFSENGLQNLIDFFNEIIESEKIPDQWLESTMNLIHKKGDSKDLSNYRPITLTSQRICKRL